MIWHKVNPPITVSKGNILEIDVSDAGLADMRLDIFEDLQFRKKLDVNGTSGSFNLIRDGIPGSVGANVQIRTLAGFPKKSFYTLTPIVPTDQKESTLLLIIRLEDSIRLQLNLVFLKIHMKFSFLTIKNFSFNLTKQPTRC